MRDVLTGVDIPSQMKENGNDAANSSQVASAVVTKPLMLLIFGCCGVTSPYASSYMSDYFMYALQR